MVEGPRLFARALAAGLVPLEVYVDGSVGEPPAGAVTMHPDVLDRVSYRARSEGILAIFPQARTDLAELDPDEPALILITDSVEKPGNLGAVLRTADAVGADAVVETSKSIDLFNPNLLRNSTGACFTVPTAVADIADLAPWLERRGIDLVAADPASPITLWEADLRGPVALMVGAEDAGLGDEARRAARLMVSIPMAGSADSLNTAVALALIAYEAVRQRS